MEWNTVNKSQKHKLVWTPGGHLGSSSVSQVLAHPEGEDFLLLFARVFPQCVSSLYTLDPSCVLWPRKLNDYFFFSIIQRAERYGGLSGLGEQGL